MVTQRSTIAPGVVDTLRQAAIPLTGAAADYDALLDMAGDAGFVLIGEASHGTHEFYRQRATITKRLIEDKGFTAVVAEADWPDAYRVNRYVRGAGDDQTAIDALGDFKRFPAWMWRNADVLDFVGWLRDYNEALPANARKTGFYGMDLYSLHGSIDAVLAYLDSVDAEAAQRARDRYGCFEFFNQDPQAYGYATSFGVAEPCEDEVIAQLLDLQGRRVELIRPDGRVAEDEYFFAEQNARLVTNAERYYRAMFHGRANTWNLRDTHMVDTLDALVGHLDMQGSRTKVVVWAHNSHLGDARATEMGTGGEVNVGQLVRERHPNDSLLIGFSTYAGAVTAATDWGGPAERKQVRPGLEGSYEALFHELRGEGTPNFMLRLRDEPDANALLSEPRLERAIGVIYRPETERLSHYFYARIPQQFDAILHFDETRAVEPLERESVWDAGELPETYPFRE